MSTARPVADEDRLPWLEPYRESKARGGRPPRRGYGKPIAVGTAIGLAIAAAGGGFWLGQRDAPEQVASDTIVVPPARPEPAPIAEAPPVPRIEPQPATRVEPVPPPSVDAAAADRPNASPAKKRKKSARRSARKRIRTAGLESSRLRAVRAAQGERTAPRTTVRYRWPRMPSPGPAGQVIQLGAFSSPSRANATYRVRVARYPALGRMPRVVVPIIPRSSRRLLYVLRLGTTSRQQSHIVCRNLRRSGDHCLVIG